MIKVFWRVPCMLNRMIYALSHNDSFHPESCKKGIIYSQALRYRRIITNNEKLTEELNKLRDNLLRRGYNLSNIQNQFSKAIQHAQHELIFKNKPPSNETTRLLPFTVAFDNTTIQIGAILKKYWHLIIKNENLKEIWTTPPFLALNRHKNFKDVLVHSRFTR